MRPALAPGDLIVFRRGEVPPPGGVVVFDHRGAVVAHRVSAELANGGLVTRGDANQTHDALPVDRSSVIGTVVYVIPFGGLIDRLVAAWP